ncbi:class I tRNA ligase family protein, partial [Candidatus Woesearchaeota archaeon]|nr:class I tRNA ligase family protein [Candidatus Woesearchaeota archaeon]
VWIDSGTASWSCLEYPHRTDLFEKYFPADFILEANEQTRLWFNMLQICSRIAFGKSCYNNVYTTGMILDIGGVKMSKSLGNIISPYEVVDKHGADVLRYYLCQIPAGRNMNFSWEDIQLKQRNLNVLWNVQNFLLDLHNQINGEEVADEGVEEKYILSRLNSTIKEVTEKLDKYEIDDVIGVVEEFYLDLSREYIQMTRDKVNESMANKKLVYNTIKKCMLEVNKMFSIVTPFITEEIFQNLKEIYGIESESVHLLDWPEFDENRIDTKLEEAMRLNGQIIQSTLAAREKAKISLRWPIKDILISTTNEAIEEVIATLEAVLKKQTNVKEIKIGEFTDVSYSVSLNFRNAGKKFGTDTGDVATDIKDVDGKVVFDAIEKEGKYMLSGKFELTKDEVSFEKVTPEHIFATEFPNGAVYLNSERNEELDKEGYAREVMRRVQDLRKKKGLEKNDTIKLHIKSSIDLSGFEDRIKGTCGVTELTISDEGSDYSEMDEFEVKKNDFMIFFEKQ